MRHQRPSTIAPPVGLAFAINDLLRVKEWADLHSIAMSLRLDHGLDGEEYEEVIALSADSKAHCFLLIWRNAEAVVAQPLVGRRRHYRSVNHLLGSIFVKEPTAVTEPSTSSLLPHPVPAIGVLMIHEGASDRPR